MEGAPETSTTRPEEPSPSTGTRGETRQQRRLERPRRGRLIGGVAAGLGDHFDLHPVLVRIGFIVLAFVGGLGLLLYAAGWLLIPEEGQRESVLESTLSRLTDTYAWIGAALIAIAAVLLIDQTGIVNSGVSWAVALIVLGVLLFRTQQRRPRDEPPRPASPDAEGAPSEEAPLPEEPAPPTPRARRAPRPRSILGRATFATVLLGIGVLALIDSADLLDASPAQYLALAVLIIGAGLLIGTWWGRSRGLIFLGLPILPFLLLISLIDVPFDGGAGERVVRPLSIEEIEDEYRLFAGKLVIDLTQVPLGTEPIDFEASVTFGELSLYLPVSAKAVISGRAGIGEVRLFGQQVDGFDAEQTVQIPGTNGGEPTTIHLETGFGAVRAVLVGTTQGRSG